MKKFKFLFIVRLSLQVLGGIEIDYNFFDIVGLGGTKQDALFDLMINLNVDIIKSALHLDNIIDFQLTDLLEIKDITAQCKKKHQKCLN